MTPVIQLISCKSHVSLVSKLHKGFFVDTEVPTDVRLVMTMNCKWIMVLTLVGASAWLGCNSKPSHSEVDAVGNTFLKWPNPQAIPVCWVQSDSTFANIQKEIEQGVVSDFGRAGLKFTGWKHCTPNDLRSAVIRIELRTAVREDRGYIAGCSVMGPDRFGFNGSCFSTVEGATMWINYDLRDRMATAIHEFGHAIGLHHEHERKDRTGSGCGIVEPRRSNLVEGNGVKFLTQYDPKSIMDYCSGASRLSDLDVEGIRKFYNTSVETAPNPEQPEEPTAPTQPTTPTRPTLPPTPKAECSDGFGNKYGHGAKAEFDGRTQTCNNGRWDAGDVVKPKDRPNSCVGVNGTVYEHGTLTSYKNHYYTCDNGNWRHDGPIVPLTQNKSCLGVDNRTYAHGILTLYRGQFFRCVNGLWFSGL